MLCEPDEKECSDDPLENEVDFYRNRWRKSFRLSYQADEISALYQVLQSVEVLVQDLMYRWHTHTQIEKRGEAYFLKHSEA